MWPKDSLNAVSDCRHQEAMENLFHTSFTLTNDLHQLLLIPLGLVSFL